MISQRPWIGFPLALLCAMVLSALLAGCQGMRPAPAAAVQPVVAGKMVWTGHYAQDVQPILVSHCSSCHGNTRVENGLGLDSYQGIMKGTQFGPVIVPGSADRSALISVIRGGCGPPHPDAP